MEEKKVPRGIRNNNPLNIKKGNKWQGERAVQTDKVFEEFVSIQYGIRAGFFLLRKYINGFNGVTPKFNTIERIIRRWAPPRENSTQRYIDYVCKETGLSSGTKIDFRNKKVMCDIVDAMIKVECGQAVDRNIIESGYDLL